MEGTPAYIQMHLLLILHRSHLEGFSNLLSTIHYVPAYINATNYRKRHDKLLISFLVKIIRGFLGKLQRNFLFNKKEP